MLGRVLKKVAITAAILATVATSVYAAADNEIIITGTVTESMIVGFQDVSLEAPASRFIGADIALGGAIPGAAWAPVTKNIFVNTNSATGVKMKIDDAAAAAGVLSGPGADVAVAYTLMGAAYTVDSGIYTSLVAAADLGSVSVGDFVITPAATGGAQTVGTYTTTLNVTLAAN